MIDLAIKATLGIVIIYILWKILKMFLIQIYLWRRGPEYRQWVKEIKAAIKQNYRDWGIANSQQTNSQTAEYDSWYYSTRASELNAEYRLGTPAWFHW